MKTLAIALLLAATALSSCGNKSCKDACDKLTACQLKSSGFSCDSNCASPEDQCAACLNDRTCDEIAAGKCASDCPNATFTK